MKFYKISKQKLKWKEMVQLDYDWKMPILIDEDYNVIIGNSLKDKLSDSIIVVVMDNNQREPLFQALYDIETRIAEENNESRLNLLQVDIRDFFRKATKPRVEYASLFDFKENGCITRQDQYIDPPPYDFNKHRNDKVLFNEGSVLLEEFLELDESKSEYEIEIDLEIMKELL